MPRFKKNKDVDQEVQELDQEEEVQKAPVRKTKGTKPGWRSSSELPKLKAPSGFHAKWAAPHKLTKLKAEGWQVMKPSDNKGDEIMVTDVNNPNAVAGELRYMDLVAVMIPQEMKDARDEYIAQENKNAMSAILGETDDQLKNMGVQTYKPKGQAGRIVID
jgi:hypothetical protein